MKITVLNGSPKGLTSITMQYVHYIQKKFPQHEFKIMNISQRIIKLEKDEIIFQDIIDAVKSSDGVLWAFPVYNFIVPSQYKRFIELIWEREAGEAFKDKYAVVLSTSVRVMDYTAHIYMKFICHDLGMKFVDYYSAEINDLLIEEERNRLIELISYFIESIEKRYPALIQSFPLTYRSFEYIPGKVETKIDLSGKKMIVITDADEKETNLGRMVQRFTSLFNGNIEIINLNDITLRVNYPKAINCSLQH